MASPVLSFRLEEEIISQLDKLAEATDRDRLYHVKRAMARYLEAESWHLQAIEVGIEAADAGKLTDLAAVKAKWVSRAESRNNRSSAE
ncbi:CopG family ribbon-helix-helix protein [Pseudomonas sp.]|uniref:CopG family ribbon-helix-helix protein n=1 Tax=Pseudomonas sp. TaxID=306 RepID=UPI002C7BEAD7|nr:ribbon-helix-helix protein, CopG family [Pseudomonas sp.]HUE91850.1 ribbon-helix-helix protein, CopG family [Pseudomonas sp.]